MIPSTLSVARIRNLAEEINTLGKTALEKATEVGKLLLECKEQLPHGQWLPWLEENFSFTSRTARRWISLAQAVDGGTLKLDTVSNFAEAYHIAAAAAELQRKTSLPDLKTRAFLLREDGAVALIEPIDDSFVSVTAWESDAEILIETKRGVRSGFAGEMLHRMIPGDWSASFVAHEPHDGKVFSNAGGAR